jgi:hypothetical protein
MQTRVGHLKISKDPTGNRSRNLSSRGKVPQKTAAPFFPFLPIGLIIYFTNYFYSIQKLYHLRGFVSGLDRLAS